MKIAKDHLTISDWQVFNEGEKITELEFEDLVDQIEDLKFGKDIPSLNSDSNVHAYYFSKQDPDFKTIFYLNPKGWINFDWPRRYKEEIFKIIDKIAELTNYLILIENFEENKTIELEKSRYSKYLSKEYKPNSSKILTDKTIGEEYKWLCVKTSKVDELKSYLNLELESKMSWDDALDKVYGNGFIIVPKANVITIVGPILYGLNHLNENTEQNHIERKIDLVEKISSKFEEIGYFMVSYKYGTGECYLANEGKLNYGQFWGDREKDVFGDESYLDGMYFKSELDISSSLFVDVRDFNRLEFVEKEVEYYIEGKKD